MCHVLIIEDEPLVAMDLQLMLEDEGATSFAFASTQAEAVEAARLQRPQLITSDVKLVEGTGPAAVQKILAEQGAVPVIFITASPDECQPREAQATVLRKPLRRVSVVETFRVLALVKVASCLPVVHGNS